MKRQANALTAVLENWQDVENAIDIYANSAGSAMRENEIYLDSWEAKSKALSASWNEFVNTFLNADMFKGFIGGATEVIKFLTEINGILPITAGILAGLLVSSILAIEQGVNGLTVSFTALNLVSGGIPLLVGALVTLIGGVIAWGVSAGDTAKQIEKLNTKIQEQQTEIDKLTDKEKDVVDLYKEYESLMSKSKAYGLNASEKENLLNISKELVDTYGLEVSGIDEVTGAYIVGANAINQYVEALRAERLEKEKEQTKTRNDRIDKNIDVIKSGDSELVDETTANKASNSFWNPHRKAVNLNKKYGKKGFEDGFFDIYEDRESDDIRETIKKRIEENSDKTQKEIEEILNSQEVVDYIEAVEQHKADWDTQATIAASKRQSAINSVVKDLITNIQVDNADMLDSNSESLLTQMLTPYLTTVDWDKFDQDEFEEKVRDFAKGSSQTLSNIAMESKAISTRISSDSVAISDYKDLIENQTKQLGGIKEMFGENSEAAKEFQKNMENSAKSNVGMMFADISNDMKDAKLDTSKFDKLATSILRLDKSMADGKITFSQYVGELNKQLDGVSVDDTFKGDTKAANEFFSVLTTKGKNAVQNLIAQMQKGAISQKEYVEGLSDIASYFAKLGDKAETLPGIKDETVTAINDYSSELDGVIKQLEKYSTLIEKMPATWEEFKNSGQSGLKALIQSFKDADVTAEDLGYTADTTIDSIVTKMWDSETDFDKVQEAMKTKFKATLEKMGVAIAKLINELTKQFGNVKFTIKAPEGGWWAALKKAIKGEDLSFGLGVETDIDENAFAKTVSNALGDLNIGKGYSFGGGGSGGGGGGGTGGSKSDKNKPDYEDPTEAIINRINLRANELEQQEEYIQNALEIAEIENDYEKQISLTNDLIANRKKRVEELNAANDALHNEAEYLRNNNPWNEEAWFDSQGNATEAYYSVFNSARTKDEQERIKNLFESLSKYKKAYAENSEEIRTQTKELLQDEETLSKLYTEAYERRVRDIEHARDMALAKNEKTNASSYYKQLQDEYHKEADRLRALDSEKYKAEIQDLQQKWMDAENSIWDENRKEFDQRLEMSNDYIQHSIDFGWENGDNEIDARKRVLAWIQSDYYKSLIKDDEEYYKILEENRLKYNNALKDAFDKATDFGNTYLESQKSLIQSQFDIENSIAEARHEINKELETSMTMYGYLDETTRKLLFNQEDYNELCSKLNDIEAESLWLQSTYEEKLRNSTAETVESITSEYQMQYDLLMKSYEIAKADLEIAKKKQQLNNALNERNVRMFINGQWQWVANTEDVANAKAELADAEYAKRVEEAGLAQQNSINALTKRQDELGVVIKKFENGIIDLDDAVRMAEKAIGNMPYALYSSLSQIGNSLAYPSNGSGNSYEIYTGSAPSTDWRADVYNANDYAAGIASALASGDVESAKAANKLRNDKIDYLGLDAEKWSDEDIEKRAKGHADGTRYTPGGLTLMGEEGFEAYISSNGRLIPINQPTIGNIPSGGAVFNSDQMKSLRTLWDMSNLNLSGGNSLIGGHQSQQIDQSQDNRIIINGMTVDGGSADGQALIDALRRYVGNH